MSILSKEQWAFLFSRDLYERALQGQASPEETKAVQSHSLKYLIAFDQPDYKILPFIEKVKGVGSYQIYAPFTEHRLTALHIATMKNRHVVAMALIRAGANIREQDAHGWTSLHHAALVSDELMQAFLKCPGVDLDTDRKVGIRAETKLGATYQNIIDLTRKGSATPDFVWYQSLEDAQPRSIGKEEVSLLGMQQYRNECFWGPKALYSLWTGEPNHVHKGLRFQEEVQGRLYPQLRQNPPLMVIKEESRENPRSFGVAAGQDLLAFSLVGDYVGEIVERGGEEGGELTYSFVMIREKGKPLLSIDADNIGNWTRFMNDGFPNLVCINLFNAMGQENRKLFFVADPEGIAKGENLRIDYHHSYDTLKWGDYRLSQKEKMRSFYRDFAGHAKAFEEMGRVRSNWEVEKVVLWKSLEVRLQYALHTPMALIDLVFSNSIDASAILEFLEEGERQGEAGLFRGIVGMEDVHFEEIKDLLYDLMGIQISLQKLEKEEKGAILAQRIRDLFLAKEDRLSVLEIVQKVKNLVQVFIELGLTQEIDFL